MQSPAGIHPLTQLIVHPASMKEEWVLDIRDQVKSAGIPFMFKHWPGRHQHCTEALLEGRRREEFPESVIKNMGWN